MSRAYTEEECRMIFIRHIRNMVDYWASEPRTPEVEEKLSGLAHSILALISGRTMGCPGFDLITSPHESDKDFHESRGENWWPCVDINDGDLARHLYQLGGQWHPRKAR